MSGKKAEEDSMKKSRQQVNETWEFVNSKGERFLFGRVGSGKNSYVKTLAYLGKVKRKKLRKIA